MKHHYLLIALTLCPFLYACASQTPSPSDRIAHAKKLAQQSNWKQHIIKTGTFNLTSFIPQQITPTKILTIYIEGDGKNWISKSRISKDPTPVNPLALKLALIQHKQAVYLARPCQFMAGSPDPSCQRSIWTNARFSSEVITATNEAIDELKLKFKSRDIQLVGFSGGGAVAALAAAKRSDVSKLVTVAGNLNHAAWTKSHRVSPLKNSLNPIDFWKNLSHVKQLHFIGEKDKVIKAHIAQSFVVPFPEEEKPTIRTIAGFSHICCWEDQWASLLIEAGLSAHSNH